MAEILTPTTQGFVRAIDVLKKGGLVAMPTETVYGLAANALDAEAVARVYAAKGRPDFNPLIVHFPSMDAIEQCVEMNEWARILGHHFWPGPLTMILPRRADCPVSELASAGLPTLGVRIPSHSVSHKLLKMLDFPLVAPSANKSGGVSPTTPEHVQAGLGDKIDIILAGGACEVGIESTVVDLSGPKPVLLRPGMVLASDIADVLETDVESNFSSREKPISPGQTDKHYAPKSPLRLNAVDVKPGEALLAFGSIKFMGVEGGGAAKDLPAQHLRNLSDEGDLYEAAANLFAMMQELDKINPKAIAVMSIPDEGLGVALNDRLRRAAGS